MEFGDTGHGDCMKQYFYADNRRGPYFEGWYFKLQTKCGESVALIPAIHIRKDGLQYASLQLITQEKSWYLEYPASTFQASRETLEVSVAGNYFSETGICVQIEQRDLILRGNVGFGSFDRLKSDIMGPFRLLRGMECVHNVISMSHTLDGMLMMNDCVLDFNGGIGYIEGDRGRSFPSKYLWTQAMWEGGSIMLSIATVPAGRAHFTGCICAIKVNGKEYRLATYRGAQIMHWASRRALVQQGRYILSIDLLEQNTQVLLAPNAGDMVRKVHEGVCAKVRFQFFKDGRALLDLISSSAGFEFAE